ncbi:MAG: hypothetical protein ACRDD4_05155 [Culicoidibacterales bacterium]
MNYFFYFLRFEYFKLIKIIPRIFIVTITSQLFIFTIFTLIGKFEPTEPIFSIFSSINALSSTMTSCILVVLIAIYLQKYVVQLYITPNISFVFSLPIERHYLFTIKLIAFFFATLLPFIVGLIIILPFQIIIATVLSLRLYLDDILLSGLISLNVFFAMIAILITCLIIGIYKNSALSVAISSCIFSLLICNFLALGNIYFPEKLIFFLTLTIIASTLLLIRFVKRFYFIDII